MRTSILLVFLLLSSCFLYGQEVWMHPNAGQWKECIVYKVELNQGEMFIEEDGFLFNMHDAMQRMAHNHDGHDHEGHNHELSDTYHAHVVRATFLESSWSRNKEVEEESSFYRNYYFGNDPNKWASKVKSTSLTTMKDFYPGIDLVLDGRNDALKYSLLVAPNVDVNKVAVKYDGADKIFVDKEGRLIIEHSLGKILEGKPIAWTVDPESGKETKVEVNYILESDVMRFEFPNGYNEDEMLVIDPDITFSSFTGASSDNWGMTATPDVSGNVFGGGIVFGAGYPTVTGSFDESYNGGFVYTAPNGAQYRGFDIGISKFTADGTSLMYSTFLGGERNDLPESMMCNQANELYVLGVTSSGDFPMAGNSYDNTFNGGDLHISNSLNFTGADLFVARLNADGTNLLSSTYVGGTGNDGLNDGVLDYNYGDSYRGEIIISDAGDVYVASTTKSTDFPIVQGSQGSLSGGQDAVVFRMPATLNALTWSTYFGGSGIESGNSLQLNSAGNVYFAGGTTSSGLFSVGHDLTYGSGVSDGYVAQLSGVNGALVSGTYIGDSEYDQAFFVQLDLDDSVYVYGQTESDYAITPGKYGNASSGQFIKKYNGALTANAWTTVIGAGTGHAEISPTAFLVSDCYEIYISGWGGVTNTQSTSTTNGFPVTANAYQSTTNGSNFYVAVLSKNATSLVYGTFMGGSTSSFNHVDGGTSRFDKNGFIYHAVCAACGGSPNGFTSTPGVWSENNQSSNCNMAVFKFELSSIEAIVAAPQTYICIPDPVVFTNNSTNGNAFFWDFGDNTTSTDENPSHLYASPGNYLVTLIVSDSNACYVPDTVQFNVDIGDFQGGAVQPVNPICPGEPYQLEAFGGVFYQWSPANVLDDPTVAMPMATIDVTTTFSVVVSDSCGSDTVEVTLEVFQGTHTIIDDQHICVDDSVQLFATGGVTYLWSPATYLDDPASATPWAKPDTDMTYYLQLTTTEGCEIEDTVSVFVYHDPPVPILPDSVFMCFGESAQITAGGALTYEWSPNINISALTGPTVTVNPNNDMYYYVDFFNPCGMTPDSVFVDVVVPSITAGDDTIICPGESVQLWATGGVDYNWTPTSSVLPNTGDLVVASPTAPTIYHVVGYDEYGCSETDSVFVDLHPMAYILASPDVYAFYGDEVVLSATSATPGPYIWSPSEFLSCVACPSPVATPNQNFWYAVSYTDENGCTDSDTVNIFYDPILYVPNTFTPDGDQFNNVFLALGGNINTFKMDIYDRWGELIFTSEDINIGWDGTHLGQKCQDGTYVWKIRLTDFQDREEKYVGHINLLR